MIILNARTISQQAQILARKHSIIQGVSTTSELARTLRRSSLVQRSGADTVAAIAGALLGLFGAVAVGVGKLFLVLLSVIFGVLALVGGALLIPLIPVLLLFGLVWLLARGGRPRQVIRPAA